MTARPPAPDEADRRAAVHARSVNVLVDAGAGTGKTTILVDRLVELVAPSGDALPAVPIGRVAAITFTRKAAGELKLRIREKLLAELARRDLSPSRREHLSAALADLDTANVGTIHGFADRLLRLRPVEARLSPSYGIVDDPSDLFAETFAVLLHAAETGSLASELEGAVDPALAGEAQAAVVDALGAGIRAETFEHQHGEWPGLDRLFERLLLTRDVAPRVPEPEKPDLGRFRDLVREFAALAGASSGDGAGSRFIASALRQLQGLEREEDPVRILHELLRIARAGRRPLRKKQDFPVDEAGWRAWKCWNGDDGKDPVRARPMKLDLVRPFASWMARRLVAMAPAVIAMYEKVKARHRTVDQIDLLLQLRNLLRDRPQIRAEYQGLLDHLLVDEFQDTDPLQAEIVLYLCEREAKAKTWRDVELAPGKLTIVGDPKQSIYRFRRADIAVYAEVRAIVERGPHLAARLSANFRSEPSLVDWLNHRFDELLGRHEAGKPPFDALEGTVANEPLVAGRGGAAGRRVAVLPLASQDGRAPAYRATEARALASWLRWLVEGRKRTVVDPSTGATRPAAYGDVAVLASSTRDLDLLFPELDRLGIPYAARGGTLFLSDPLHRQFLLGLRAVADRDDGVAQAALLRPPFFAVDPEDLARARAAPEDSAHPGVLSARAALEMVRDLRRRRLERPPGAIARDLLERTALGRAVALGPNGAQRLDALRELCLALDSMAAAEGLDFDAATARLRAWVTDPVQLDPPRPVASDAVEVLTVHQAKGLEFPVVVLWDACAELAARDHAEAFAVDRGGGAWALALDGIEWSEPEGGDFAGQEKRYLDAERRRLVYVAATRARDLLVLPVAGRPDPRYVTGRLAQGGPEDLVETLEPYALEAEPAWARELPPPKAAPRRDASPLAGAVAADWRAAAEEAARPRYTPAAVTAEARRIEDERPGEAEAGFARGPRPSRFGAEFGTTVHLAIGLCLRHPALAPEAAVDHAARETGISERRAEAAADVRRALGALGRAGLRRPPGADLQLEYPVAMASAGRLVSGYVDLVASQEGRLVVVDFKTDAPPAGEVALSHGAYAAQVRTYARILEELGLAAPGTVRTGLLYTADGEVRWVN